MASMRIAEVAARSGLPASTLRYYDRIGLVPSERAANGYRAYDDVVFDRLRFIDAARHLDLPLDGIATLLRSWESDPCASVKQQLRPMLEAHLHDVDESIATLSDLRDHLESARAHLDALPDRDARCDPSCAFLLREQPPVACALGTDRGEQVEQWRALLEGHEPERLGTGVRYRLSIDELTRTAELAASEQACCPFFSFDLALRGDAVLLTIRAPREGMPLLAELAGIPDLASPA